jgi:hypothetical protein
VGLAWESASPASDAEHGAERVVEIFAGGGKVCPQPLVEI